jgi:hypothetical protein
MSTIGREMMMPRIVTVPERKACAAARDVIAKAQEFATVHGGLFSLQVCRR